MMKRERFVFGVVVSLAALLALAVHPAGTLVAQALRPVPRLSDGAANLGITNQDKGVWIPRDRTELGRRSTLAPVDTIPFQPWARVLWDERQKDELEPHSRCHPSGAAREFQTPYGVDFVQLPELQRIFIFDIGGPHTFRTVYMNARHPAQLNPSAYGHSIGQWDGDTLVVDTVGYSESFWIDRTGLPHTEKLHTVERFTRTSFNTIKYEMLIDDPSIYTRPWTGGFDLSWSAGAELFEYVCQDNNTAPATMTMDGGQPLRLTSPIAP